MKVKIKRKNKKVLQEAAKTVQDLPEGQYVEVVNNDYVIEATLKGPYTMKGKVKGYVTAYKVEPGECVGTVYRISNSRADAGWGPMLYDLVLELATRRGASVASDRKLVSSDAWNVWNYYLKNRSDVIQGPAVLDVNDETMRYYYGDDPKQWPFKQRTDTKRDDCQQFSSMEWATGKGDWYKYSDDERREEVIDNPEKAKNWYQQPTSKAYIKNNADTLKQLSSLGILRDENGNPLEVT